ncbi:hypothetical protein IS481_14795 [Caldimonas thermodepolymerans]|uniref:Uncharacterized protein n=1 Tax=Caldimonas thermodepolymerans TaxID=215580 RepID=A0A2S5T3G6_9BURK|nr:hypothetical protein [Caldimonas thermodepolymerans]PPE69496.1 hypothetical protein C1702_11170 [Caldimonas thermodepolymerans]QPC30990.1 hypothetical protein IS481_14795 [Caldimonas thermodepolymerans]RDH96996.1 hypothetical protein DES46_10911 [Caldimonas thermodepolymerans]
MSLSPANAPLWHSFEARESLDERAFYAAKSLPKFYRDTLAFEPVLLKSNLFRPASGARTRYDVFTELKSYNNTRIEYRGEELRQDDLRVLLTLLKLRSGDVVSNAIEFTPRTFCRDVLGWADSSDSVAKLKACILRLQDARARVHFKGGMLAMSFVSDAVLRSNDAWTVWLSDLLLPVFERNLTYLKASERLAMKDGLESWLYGFIKADSCTLEFDLSTMREAAGSTYEQKDFNKHVKKVLEGFEADGIVASFEVSKGKLKVRKS